MRVLAFVYSHIAWEQFTTSSSMYIYGFCMLFDNPEKTLNLLNFKALDSMELRNV